MRSKVKKVACIILVAFFILFLILFWLPYSYGLSLRKSAIINGWNDLKEAQLEVLKGSKLSNDHVFLYTNNFIINGTNYQGAMAVKDERFFDEGILIVTTNRVLIWLDKSRGPKIIKIPPNYNPPIFSSGF